MRYFVLAGCFFAAAAATLLNLAHSGGPGSEIAWGVLEVLFFPFFGFVGYGIYLVSMLLQVVLWPVTTPGLQGIVEWVAQFVVAGAYFSLVASLATLIWRTFRFGYKRLGLMQELVTT